jgi:hypothetical protein
VRRADEEHGSEDEIGEQVHVYTVVLGLNSRWQRTVRDTVRVDIETACGG